MASRFLIHIFVPAIILSVALSATSFGQAQKYDDPYQKSYPWQKSGSPVNEEDQKQQDQGGYQAPPPTGSLEGATREFGLSTGEIEIPAIRLRLPRVRLPSLSMFLTPPRMHTDGGIAPMVQQVQNQISVPTGATPPAESADQTGSKGKGMPYQKVQYQNGNHATDFAQIRGEMEEFENRLDSRIALLASSIEKLVEVKEREMERQRPRGFSHVLDPLPIVEDVEQSAVRQSSYTTTSLLTPTPSVHNELRRLPTTTPPPSDDIDSTNHLRRLPTIRDVSNLTR